MQERSDYPIKWITPAFSTCYAPQSETDLDEIRRQGISVIVNMCAECYDLAEIEEQAGFNVYRLSVADMEAPSLDDLESAMVWLENHLATGRKALIHCRYGIGRTGTFALTYLMRNGETLKSAIEKLKPTPSSPQSKEQWAFVEQYAKIKLQLKELTIPPSEQKGVGIFFKRQLDRLKWF
ncbi:MAG: dual specificity protein phosphatase family protein [Desulfobacteraceae bacterium]